MKSLFMISFFFGFFILTSFTAKLPVGSWIVEMFENKEISEQEKNTVFTFYENGDMERTRKNDVTRKGTWKFDNQSKILEIRFIQKDEPELMKVLTLNSKLLRLEDKRGLIIRMNRQKGK